MEENKTIAVIIAVVAIVAIVVMSRGSNRVENTLPPSMSLSPGIDPSHPAGELPLPLEYYSKCGNGFVEAGEQCDPPWSVCTRVVSHADPPFDDGQDSLQSGTCSNECKCM